MNTDGTLDIQIPRNSIDAIHQNGQDESFIVVIHAVGIMTLYILNILKKKIIVNSVLLAYQ